jgi:glycosyltransferase involved in cell wall biosynthesis
MSNPLVSYIIPSYNHAQYISKAIDSVLSQTYQPIELIIVDDGSSDNTREVLLQYENHPDITIIFNEINLRQSATVNKALKIAKGEFIGLLPSDDWLLPEKVELQMKKFSTVGTEVGVIYARGARFFEGETKQNNQLIETQYNMKKGFITKNLIQEGNFIYPITPLFRKECFEKYPFDESYTAEGEAIYLKISLSYQFDYITDVVGVMRDHVDNTGKKTDIMYEQNMRYRIEFMELGDVPPEIKLLKNEWLGELLKIKAMELIASKKEYSKGRSLAINALKHQPSYLTNPKFIICLFISCLPSKVADFLIENFYKRKSNY